MDIFIVTIRAIKKVNDETGLTGQSCFVLFKHSQQDADVYAAKEAHDRWPDHEGWSEHATNVNKIPITALARFAENGTMKLMIELKERDRHFGDLRTKANILAVALNDLHQWVGGVAQDHVPNDVFHRSGGFAIMEQARLALNAHTAAVGRTWVALVVEHEALKHYQDGDAMEDLEPRWEKLLAAHAAAEAQLKELVHGDTP